MSMPRPVAALLALACLVLPTFAAAQPATPSTRPSTSPSPSAAVPPMPGASTPEEINRLRGAPHRPQRRRHPRPGRAARHPAARQIGRASCRERVSSPV